MKLKLAAIFFVALPACPITVSIANVAAATTIAVNAEAIVKAVRHPVRTAKTVAKKTKDAVKK